MGVGKFGWILVGFLLLNPLAGPGYAAQGQSGPSPHGRSAIVLASFGTTVPTGLGAIVNIRDQVSKAFPGVPVRITFTSNMIRAVWKKRQAQADQWLARGVPADVLYVRNIIATLGDLLEEGYKDIVVQPTHIFFMEQSHDLQQYIAGLNSIRTLKTKWRPFGKLVMGRPALGMPGERHNYRQDLEKALLTLAPDVEQARRQNAALVYMGHGNDHWSSGIFLEAAKMMRSLYPDVATYMAGVEGFPGLEDLCADLAGRRGRVILKPFMIVAGDHAANDMAGEDGDSWKNTLTRKGFEVIPILEGLGSNDAFAALFVQHIRDAARDAGIVLER